VFAAAEGASSASSRKSKSEKTEAARGKWIHGGTVLQKVVPEREREQRLTLVGKLEDQIRGLWRELAGNPKYQNDKHPDRSGDSADVLDDEIRTLKRRMLEVFHGDGGGLCFLLLHIFFLCLWRARMKKKKKKTPRFPMGERDAY